MTKRTKTDCFYETIASVCEEQVDASICGVVKALSPVKRSKNNTAYFHGELADNTGHIRLFGFNTTAHKQLQKHYEAQTPVMLKGCNINVNSSTDNLEVKVLHKTKVQESKKAIAVQKLQDKEAIQISQSKLLPAYETITIQAKILAILDPMKISAHLTKQDVIIGDSSGTMKVTVWNDDVYTLAIEKSYQFTDLQVRTYRDQKFLTTSLDGLKKLLKI